MALQPLVENAIRHGIARSSSAARIKISAARSEEVLEVRVQDDGPGFTARDIQGDLANRGIGLSNTRERLRQLYGQRAGLRTANDPQGGAVVTMTIPYRKVTAAEAAELMETHALHNANR